MEHEILKRPKQWHWRVNIPGLVILCMVVLMIAFLYASAAYFAKSSQKDLQTDIEVRAFVGNHAKNKLGVIEFAVSNRWDYHRVIFQVWGFDKGLNLDNVVCREYDNGKYIEEVFFRQNSDWNMWLERFQEVLAEATVGEKNTDLFDPNAISVE